ncbi:MAG TPA: S8 family serine peptidase [Pyrinomonadaceae bacterium]|nr:S8 family serine peptidase [Pyrinomonadaceae bacterium]
MNNPQANIELKSAVPIFEGFTLEMVKPGLQRKARAAVTSVLGNGWQTKQFGDRQIDFEVIRKTRKKTDPGWAWDKTYLLRAQPGVVMAEPMFTVPVSAPPEFREEAREIKPPKKTKPPAKASLKHTKHPAKVTVPDVKAADSGTGTPPLPESDDPQWSIKEVKVPEAWQRFPANKEPGDKVIIGHPDTGYSEHPEILSRLLKNRGHDFVKDDADAKDDLNSGPLLFPGHGTGTSSVIVSPGDAQSNFGNTSNGTPIAVWGVAPGATLIPFRVSRSVVLDTFWAGSGVRNLAKAIELAADRGAHVISISLGTGFPNSRLLKAVQYAQRRGVIILAAAGNYVPFVVWPAAYSEVIAVAASNARRQTWQSSSFGSAVDVTAPGESVWNAGVAPNQFSVGRGSGTSYAVATVAGIAALWLSHHGRDKLIQQYGAEKIPVVFNQILRDSCDQVAGWPSGFGRGLVNADKLLTAPLPGAVAAPVPLMSEAMVEHPAIGRGNLTTFHHLFETAMKPAVAVQNFASTQSADEYLWAALSELLQVTIDEVPARLKEVGQELAFNFAADPVLYKQFAEAVSQPKEEGLELPAAFAAESDAAANLATVRAELLAKPTSKALKQKLS